MIPKIRFQNRDQSIVVKVLTRRVNRYFKDNNISRNANFHMVIKSICMFLIYLVPYVLDGKVVVRPIMYLALSYDHRIIDGRESVGFLCSVKEALENPIELLLSGEDKVKENLGL